MSKRRVKVILTLGIVLAAFAASAQDTKRVVKVGSDISEFSSTPVTPVKCDGAKPIKLFVGVAIRGTDTHKEARGHSGLFVCWDREVDSEAELRRLHDRMEVNPKVTQITIISVMKLRS